MGCARLQEEVHGAMRGGRLRSDFDGASARGQRESPDRSIDAVMGGFRTS